MNVFPRDPRLDHRLNAPCPECGDAQWLHTDRCLTRRRVSRTKTTGCQCTLQAEDFTPRHPHEVFGPVQEWGYAERSRP